ncbi:MAG: T9SS type A sorting domain-containing protein [Bacteroidetes bacterium]|nr:T9SS type A sorting domain-containing protein [Bacteroidota bacterium]
MKPLFTFLIFAFFSFPGISQTIEKAEYYLDSDPGEGNGTVLISDDGNFNDVFELISGTVETQLLPAGPHLLGVRVQTKDGIWSSPIKTVIIIHPEPGVKPENRTDALTQAEYFLGTDPGTGNGQSLSITGNGVSVATGSIPTAELSGSQLLSVRFKTASGLWTVPTQSIFRVTPVLSAKPENLKSGLAAAEGFFNSDPGEGNGFSLGLTSGHHGNLFSDFSGSLVIPSLNSGRNNLNIRIKDDNNVWSVPVIVPVTVVQPEHAILVAWENPASRDSVTSNLTQLGLGWDDWYLPAGDLSFSGWNTLIWDEKDWVTKTQRDSLKSFLSGGSENSLVISGENIAAYHDHGRAQADTTFLYHYLKGKLRLDNSGAGKKPAFGRLIHNGFTDSVLVVDQDVIRPVNGSQSTLAWFENKPDSAFAVNYDGVFNTAFSTFYWKNMTVGLNGFLDRTLNWISGSGGSLPVELADFKGEWVAGKIRLTWSTRSELNNAGWEIQKSEVRSQKSEVSPSTPLRDQNADWNNVGFVAGKGTTTDAQFYSFLSPVTSPSSPAVYRLKQIDLDGNFTYSELLEMTPEFPTAFSIGQNFPNPFNPETRIRVDLPDVSEIRFEVFNLLGQLVKSEVLKEKEAGSHLLVWNGKNQSGNQAATGVYFYRISLVSLSTGKKFTETRSMVMVK